MVIATHLTSICCVYKEKRVKNDLYQRTSIKIQKVAIFDTDRKKNQFNSKKSFRYYIDFFNAFVYS